MSKVIVGINIDNTVKLPSKGSISVEVTSIKALDLDNMELVDIGIDNCEDVIGIKVDKDFDNTFTIATGKKELGCVHFLEVYLIIVEHTV